ncbi:MAG: hypothetical protein GY861_18930 [bacterium]|nr:hypothetical protein [bacterium]
MFVDDSNDVGSAMIVVEHWPKLKWHIEAFESVEVRLGDQLAGSHNG